MAKQEEESVGSDRAELKRMLKLAMDKPIHMAFALDGNGKAMVKVDKLKQPKALEKVLKEGDKDSKLHRFGTVTIDPDDKKVAVFMINKAAAGFARKLTVALKGTGFSKVRIVMEDGTTAEEAADEDEGDEDEDEGGSKPQARDQPEGGNDLLGGIEGAMGGIAGGIEGAIGGIANLFGGGGAAATSATPTPQASAGGDNRADEDESDPDPGSNVYSGQAQGAGGDQPDDGRQSQTDYPAQTAGNDQTGGSMPYTNPGDDGAGQQSGQPDAGALAKQLKGLVKQMLTVIAQNPSQKAALAQLATSAQQSLKQGDLQGASAGMDILTEALADASGADGSGGANGADAGQNANGAAANAGGSTDDAPDATAANASTGQGDENGAVPDSDASAPPADVSGDPAARKLHKSHAAWRATRAKVDNELQKLVKAVMAAAEGEEMVKGFEEEFQKVVGPMLDEIDGELSDVMQKAAAEKDGEKRRKLMEHARGRMEHHRKSVESNEIIVNIDSNPFLQVAVGKTLTSTLNTLSAALN